ncbi:hypothetical protein JG687_00005803 [Phytophthora cactorum]|uniref:non-specific serine/threonine protein kinase n=1 Tax=Phytophthora cactorum TaxID=29920 RepID=A0A8T1UJV5_9STRA|nr:hypothetical protein JG687_00005803 [Phytophthora cactorum]
MMNERRHKLSAIQVDHYDGQAIYSGNELIYELGGYLGGGAAGVVYEAFSTRTKQHVAIKILNPVGYKLFPSTLLARCIVAVKGKPLVVLPSDEAELGDDGGPRANRRAFAGGNHRMRSNFASPKGTTERIRVENVWWLIHPTSKQAIAAFEDPHTGHVRELTLPQCIQVWGEQMNQSERQQADPDELYQEVQVKNQTIKVPRIPKKFIKFAHTRRSIHREISNMSGLEYHENVLRLDEALELVQDSKCTTFLVLELAGGGELFDRIKLDCGTNEETARLYFRQLISGVAFCHNSGVCHRDLKPENLLLADNEEHSTLKIADFGLSAIFAFTDSDASGGANGNGVDQPAIRRLRSVVGSPHYVAPEVLMDAGQGYDGAKADAWSIGIILYAMIAGNLPFGKDLLKCVRYDRFRKWSYNTKYSDDDPTDEVEFPTWFFPAHFSMELKSLIAQMLYPDACMRLAVEEAQRHTWSKDVQAGEEQQAASVPPPSYSDVVARSTRFLTALPARLVLSNIENALKTNPCPLPYEYPKVPQNVSIDWDNYQLEVRYAGLLTCTVQVFLFQRGVYLVEFRRGHVDIFQFKRFYEKIRAQISEGMDGGTERPSPAFRKRNNSISETF